MDFEATSGRALPGRPEHALRMTVLPLQERAVVLRQAARALQQHLLVGHLLPAEESPRCHSLIALGGGTCLGLKGRPYFAARGEMVRMLEGLAAHCVTQWQQRLSRLLHVAPMADFLGGFFPLAPAGRAPLWPYQRAKAALPAGAAGRTVRRLGSGAASGRTGGPLLSARARQGTWLHRRALPHTWGADMRALPGNGPGSCQLLPERTHKPTQGNRSANGLGIVRHVTGHAEAAAGGAGLRGHRHAWLVGCSGRVSRGTRMRRRPLRRWPRSETTGKRASAGGPADRAQR